MWVSLGVEVTRMCSPTYRFRLRPGCRPEPFSALKSEFIWWYGGVRKWGYPKMDDLSRKFQSTWMIWGCTHVRKPPYLYSINPSSSCFTLFLLSCPFSWNSHLNIPEHHISTNISTTHAEATQQVERIHRRHQRNGLGTHASVGDIRLQLHDDQNPKDLVSHGGPNARCAVWDERTQILFLNDGFGDFWCIFGGFFGDFWWMFGDFWWICLRWPDKNPPKISKQIRPQSWISYQPNNLQQTRVMFTIETMGRWVRSWTISSP